MRMTTTGIFTIPNTLKGDLGEDLWLFRQAMATIFFPWGNKNKR